MHIKSLDGLRGLAALWVCVSHFASASGTMPAAGDGGKIGVMVFFALSGFLMGHLYFNQSPSQAAVGEFFRKRAARVLPLYFLIVAVSFAFMMVAEDLWPYHVWAHRLPAHLFLIKGTHVLWTIPIEVQFYLLFPLFWLLRHKLGDKAVWLFAGLLVLFYLLPPLPMERIIGSWHLFAAGLVIACIPARAAPVWNVGFLASIAAVILICPNVAGPEGAYAVWRSPVALLAIASLLVCTIRAPLAHVLLGCRPLMFLGRISYSLYLLHFIPLHVLTKFTDLDGWMLAVVFTVATLALSYASYAWIERPARRFFAQGFAGQTTAAGSGYVSGMSRSA